jgi:predicted secreted protein
MIDAAMNGSIERMRFLVPNFGTFEGPYYPTTIEVTGEYNGAVQYNGSYGSAGTVVFTAV